jgi:hypothetical protein
VEAVCQNPGADDEFDQKFRPALVVVPDLSAEVRVGLTKLGGGKAVQANCTR